MSVPLRFAAIDFVTHLLQAEHSRGARHRPGKRGIAVIGAAAALCLSACALCSRAASPANRPASLPPNQPVAASANQPADEPAGEARAELRTEHYDLTVEGLDANDTGAMLEQLHARLRDYFGIAPAGRLAVSVYATQARWAAELRKDRQLVPPAAGGYYAPFTRKAYLWLQPSAYSTRQLILHEATHQFHFLVATGNLSPSAVWYTEGLAEYFGMHNWDGKRLEVGVIPAITLEDYPAAALKSFEAAGSDLERMLPQAARPESWALVHFLLNNYRAQFRAMAARLDRQEDASKAWDQVFGGESSRLSVEFHQWIQGHAQPWKIVCIRWQQRGDVIAGESQKTNSLAILKETPKVLSVELTTLTPGGMAGLVFAYQAEKYFSLLQVLPDRKVRVLRRQNASWVTVFTGECPAADGPTTLSAMQDGKSTTLWVNGEKIATLPEIGQVGLNTEGCQALFRIKQPSGL
jgi:hypothetical protein